MVVVLVVLLGVVVGLVLIFYGVMVIVDGVVELWCGWMVVLCIVWISDEFDGVF